MHLIPFPIDPRPRAAARHVIAQHAAAPRMARFAGWALDLANRQLLTRRGAIVAYVPETEFALLMTFLSQPREVLSRDYLIVQTQGAHRYTTSRTLDVYVSRLRRRLRAGRRCANVIGTRYKLGYVFNADPV